MRQVRAENDLIIVILELNTVLRWTRSGYEHDIGHGPGLTRIRRSRLLIIAEDFGFDLVERHARRFYRPDRA